MRIGRTSSIVPLAAMLALGALSGVATAQFPFDGSKFKLFDVPLAPGLIFGGVLALGCLQWGSARWSAIATVLITAAAWVGPVRLFIEIEGQTGQYLAGLAAGALGGAGSALAVAASASAMRRLPPFLIAAAVGGAVGPLINVIPEPVTFFVIWQGAVAAAIGSAFATPAGAPAT